MLPDHYLGLTHTEEGMNKNLRNLCTSETMPSKRRQGYLLSVVSGVSYRGELGNMQLPACYNPIKAAFSDYSKQDQDLASWASAGAWQDLLLMLSLGFLWLTFFVVQIPE